MKENRKEKFGIICRVRIDKDRPEDENSSLGVF
jgi:hypothetical protein